MVVVSTEGISAGDDKPYPGVLIEHANNIIIYVLWSIIRKRNFNRKNMFWDSFAWIIFVPQLTNHETVESGPGVLITKISVWR